MKQSVRVNAARFAGGALMSAALLPVLAVGAHATSEPGAPSTGRPSHAVATPYADQVAVGPATKIGNPAALGDVAATSDVGVAPDAVKVADPGASRSADPVDTSTVTPSDAVVIETESHQPAEASTAVAVLGTKIGATPAELATTGPSHVSTEVLVALALLVAGLLLRAAPALWDSARTAAARRH